ncbi:MAG TPA: hypothetical protein VJ438_03360 [Candidatus Nanoarchaeia archaeon]|nr:hypothetical protein [Candidatus Nanoarchaeia archaeon]
MAPIINVAEEDFERASKLLELANVDYTLLNTSKSNSTEYFEVPSLKGIKIAKQRTLLGKSWYESHEALQSQGQRMITLPEFAEVLKYTQKELPEVYEDITAVRNPWRVEWIDAFFEEREDGMYILTGNKTRAEKLKPCLMEDRTPGISLDSWIENPTNQGLPKRNAKEGDLYFWAPKSGAVAGFVAIGVRADLDCVGDPTIRNSILGVRAVKTA